MDFTFERVQPCLLNFKALQLYLRCAYGLDKKHLLIEAEHNSLRDDLAYHLYGDDSYYDYDYDGNPIGKYVGCGHYQWPTYYRDSSYVWRAPKTWKQTPLGQAVVYLADHIGVDPEDWIRQYLRGNSRVRWRPLSRAHTKPYDQNTVDDWIRLLSITGVPRVKSAYNAQ